jgi:flagellar M-ring protein FliF
MEGAGIEGARVHIVIPEKSVFKDEQRDPTASIVLKLKPTATIDENNVAAISNLVASSVEGLKPEKNQPFCLRAARMSGSTVANSWHPDNWGEDGAWMRMFRNARVRLG